jgi:hypothetical protein
MFLYFVFRISRLDIGNTSYLITNAMPAIHALAISAVLVATTVKAEIVNVVIGTISMNSAPLRDIKALFTIFQHGTPIKPAINAM